MVGTSARVFVCERTSVAKEIISATVKIQRVLMFYLAAQFRSNCSRKPAGQ